MRALFFWGIFLACSLWKDSLESQEPSPLQKPKKTIAIVTFKIAGINPWDPRSVQSGIPGSEEAVIYISQKLVKYGYQVTVFGNPPQGSPYSHPQANPRFTGKNFFTTKNTFDIALSWRMPGIAKALKEHAKKVYFWPHDTCACSLSEEQIQNFDDVFWLSHFQREQWISINPGFAKFTKIFGNGILPEQFHPLKKRKNPFSCIYGSNYGRGLELLLDCWPMIKQKFPQATLDIYYGWKHWGLLSKEKEARLRVQVATLAPLGVEEHGYVGHEELNRAFERASIWAYPCTSVETFCITALRAQLAGAIPVVICNTGLKETVRNGYKCEKSEEYLNLLLKAMEESKNISLQERKKMGVFILQDFTWKSLAQKWHELFEKDPASSHKALHKN